MIGPNVGSSREQQWSSRFQLLEELGRGAMGIVYEAFDREQGKKVALKTIRNPEPEQILRFKREFRALRDVRHRNLVQLGELIEEGGRWLFTMELVRGEPVLEYVWLQGPVWGGESEQEPRGAKRDSSQAARAGPVTAATVDLSRGSSPVRPRPSRSSYSGCP